MSYEDLYNHCQNLSPKVSRADIIPRAQQLTGRTVAKRYSSMDPTILSGYFLSSSNQEHPIIKQHNGSDVIVLSRGLNYCWKRLVEIKETMHLFDTPDERISTPEQFEALINAFSGPPQPPSQLITAQYMSEGKAFWMALGVLCPETARRELMRQRNAGAINDYGIALQLRIPEFYVPWLFIPNFTEVINSYF